MGLSWLSIIGAAGYYNIVLEVYLLTLFIGIGAYSICNLYRTKSSEEITNGPTQAHHTPPKENYLEVFMPREQTEYNN